MRKLDISLLQGYPEKSYVDALVRGKLLAIFHMRENSDAVDTKTIHRLVNSDAQDSSMDAPIMGTSPRRQAMVDRGACPGGEVFTIQDSVDTALYGRDGSYGSGVDTWRVSTIPNMSCAYGGKR
jgi:hypothetical protein